MIDFEVVAAKAQMFLFIFLVVCILVILAIALDLWDRLYTQKKTGGRVRSHKIRITIEKMSEYWRFLVIGLFVDCVGVLFDFYKMPFAVVLFGVGLLLIETKSMVEHARERKSHAAELPDLIRKIIDCAHEKDARTLIEELKQAECGKQS